LLNIKEGAYVKLKSSKFERVGSLGYGGVVFADSRSIFHCESCIFNQNFAIYGAVAHLQNEAKAEFINTLFLESTAFRGGVTHITNEGRTEF